jgi:hypothetical protein
MIGRYVSHQSQSWRTVTQNRLLWQLPHKQQCSPAICTFSTAGQHFLGRQQQSTHPTPSRGRLPPAQIPKDLIRLQHTDTQNSETAILQSVTSQSHLDCARITLNFDHLSLIFSSSQLQLCGRRGMCRRGGGGEHCEYGWPSAPEQPSVRPFALHGPPGLLHTSRGHCLVKH